MACSLKMKMLQVAHEMSSCGFVLSVFEGFKLDFDLKSPFIALKNLKAIHVKIRINNILIYEPPLP